MTRRCIGLLVTLTLAVLVAPFPTEAQPPPTVHRIGLLRTGTASAEQPFLESIRQGLRDLGYVEGQNLIIEPRYAEGSDDRLRTLAAELVQLRVEVIVAGGSAAIHAAQHATRTIPIVMAFSADSVARGFVASLARPDCRARRREPPARHVRLAHVCRGRGPHVLWAELAGPAVARRLLRRSPPEGRQAWGPAGGAADDLRIGDQPQNGPGIGPHHAPIRPLPSHRCAPVSRDASCRCHELHVADKIGHIRRDDLRIDHKGGLTSHICNENYDEGWEKASCDTMQEDAPWYVRESSPRM
jgi:hypothetical protein